MSWERAPQFLSRMTTFRLGKDVVLVSFESAPLYGAHGVYQGVNVCVSPSWMRQGCSIGGSKDGNKDGSEDD